MASAGEPAPHLIGVGVGPGDPDLVTVKAVRALAAADVVLVPATEASGDGPGRAELIVTAAVPDHGRLVRIPFTMGERRGVGPRRREAWEISAEAAVDAFEAGAGTVAFATVGDPSVYSTFSYLADGVRRRVPGVEVSVIPGITAMQALAAASTTPLVEGREVLCLFPNTAGSERLSDVLDAADTVVIYKGGRKLPEVLTELRRRGRRAVIGTDVSLPHESIAAMSADCADDAAVHYFSTVLSAPYRTDTGGQL